MQRVPQIRIFGSSASDWKREGSVDKYERRFVDTWTSSSPTVSSQFRKTYYQQPVRDRQLQIGFMRRSNSVTRLTPMQKPSEMNYYANAIRICDNNKVLRNIKGHGAEYLNSTYLVKGCKRPLRSECLQCKEQERMTQLRKENYRKKQQNNRQYQYYQQQQSSCRTNKQSDTGYMNFEQQQQMNTRRNNLERQTRKQQQFYNNSNSNIKSNNNTKKIVSFQQIIDSSNQVKQPTFRVIQQQGSPQFRQIKTERSVYTNNNNYGNTYTNGDNSNNISGDSKMIVTEQSRCDSLLEKEKENEKNRLLQSQQKIRQQTITTTSMRTQQNHFLPQISCLINQLTLIGQLGQSESTYFMLDELKQAARKGLEVRKDCISKLDDIIDKFGTDIDNQTVIETHSYCC